MPTVEFQIRAWQMDDAHAQGLVHSSSAGDIRKPLTIPCNLHRLNQARGLFQQNGWFLEPDVEGRLLEIGRQLADLLLPRPVYALLTSSLQTLEPGSILRVRLCLDAAGLCRGERAHRPCARGRDGDPSDHSA